MASRRAFLIGAASVTLVPLSPARATSESMAAAIKAIVGDRPVGESRVTLDVPPLVENGNTVPLTVSVDSPMTQADHIRAIHVFNEKNPQPHVFSATLGPRNGKAVVATRIKLGDSQRVVALAESGSGELWMASVDVIVTLAACLEETT